MAEIVDQRAEALKYLEKHNILKLFDYLGAKLAKDKPDDPNEFLATEIEKIIEAKSSGEVVTLFTENDIGMMFSIFDITGKGYVSQEQYSKALVAVGVTNSKNPPPDTEKIDKETFISKIYDEIQRESYGAI